MTERITVLVSGMVAGEPGQGGATWSVLQYLLGLRRLGHRAVLVEPIERAQLGDVPLDASAPAAYFRAVAAEFDLDGALVLAGSTETVGMPYADVVAAAGEAELLLNVAGMLRDPEILERPRRRAYLDVDPAFTQLWQHADGIDMRLDGHDHHVTVGLNVGRAGCDIPTCGRRWRNVPPIVSLPDWPAGDEIVHDAFTTVGNWRGYGSVHHDGVHYGQRAHSMRPLVTLPELVEERFEPALAIHPAEVDDLLLLRRHGWRLLDPREVADTPSDYQRFVRGSKAELGVAKSGYVVSRSGWFSDRSACYLAAGRPVVAQDTGFGESLPTGEGLLAYASVAEAADAVRAVTADYARHRAAARRLAVDHLAAERVLPPLLDELLV